MKQLDISILYHFIPHYRRGFVETLDGAPQINALWLASKEGREGIKTLPPSSFKNYISTYTFWLGQFIIQPRAIAIAIFGRRDCYVFLASPYFITTWLAALILRMRRKRVVFWGHGPQKGLRRISSIERIFYGLATAHYLYGYWGRKNLIELGIPSRKIYVGLNSLMPPKHMQAPLDRASRSAERERPTLRVVALSRLIRSCRYDLLIAAAERATNSYGLDIELVFIGDGECREELKRQSDLMSVRAKFLGAIYDEEKIASILQNSDCLAQPGKVGLSAMHALSYGLPVITHNSYREQMPEVESIIPGVTGFLHEKDNIDDIARALMQCKAELAGKDSTYEACRRMATHIYSPERQVRIFINCIQGTPPDSHNSVEEIFYEK